MKVQRVGRIAEDQSCISHLRRGRRGIPEMTSLSLALIAVTIVLSSFVSGVFGMAGGMISARRAAELSRRRRRHDPVVRCCAGGV
jgi:hypothetical protein